MHNNDILIYREKWWVTRGYGEVNLIIMSYNGLKASNKIDETRQMLLG